MASLIENNSTDFKAAMETADKLSSLLCGYEDGTTNSQPSSMIALDDDLWKELYLLPTPPLSPECLSTTDSTGTSTREEVSDAGGGGDGLYVNMMEYDQMMDVLEEAERVLTDSQQSYQQDLLLQDCMWSGGSCVDSLLSAVSNPAASITITNPTSASVDGTGDAHLSETPLDDNQCSHNEQEPDCVEPSAVFPVLKNSADARKTSSAKPSSFKSSNTLCPMRSHASMSSSESGQSGCIIEPG